jgi:hypothetical protein
MDVNPESAEDELRGQLTREDFLFLVECGVSVRGLDLRDELKVLRG